MTKKSLVTTDTFDGNEIYAPHDFNEERTMAFTTLKRQRQKDSISWLITGLLLFFFTMMSAGRLTIVGQFFDDAIFNLIFGWFKFPIYLLLLSFDLAIYFGVRFKFKLRFLFMILWTSMLLCWGISLVLFTYIYDQELMFHEVTIKGMWSKTFFPDSFKIYWFNWLDNSVFGTSYATHDKMDFLISARGYVTLYGGGGLIGTLLAAASAYLSIPGAFAIFAFATFITILWVLTGDPFYLFKPKSKRRGRSLRILSLKTRNNPNKLKKKVKPAAKAYPVVVESTQGHNEAVDLAIGESDLTIKMPSYKFSTNDEMEDLKKIEREFTNLNEEETMEESFNSNRKSRSFPIFEPRQPRPQNSAGHKTFPHFENLTKEWQNQQNQAKDVVPEEQEQQVRYQSRRPSNVEENNQEKINLTSEIPFAKIHQNQNLVDEETILNPMPEHGQYGDVDPSEARKFFNKETNVTPFGNLANQSELNEVEREIDTEADFLKTLYETVNDEETIDISQEELNQIYQLPSLELLQGLSGQLHNQEKNEVIAQNNAEKIDQVFEQFSVKAKVINWAIGPSVTKFEIQPALGTKVSAFTTLENDLKLALASTLIRLEAPIPGKNLIGLEIPNKHLTKVSLKEIIAAIPESKINHKLLFVLGKKVSGAPLTANLESMPHLLIAGSTGSGKSMMINTLIVSLLMRATPDEVKFLMIDPKRVELSLYSQIPHILTPVITRSKEAAYALKELVEEMEERYDNFAKIGARNIDSYNRKLKAGMPKLPFIVVIIDELADLMVGDEHKIVEESIMRLAQMARAAGIHLVLATQRPSVDVITGTIKTNIPTRIAFAVSSSIDSRTIIDFAGAEKLIGRGDMLFVYPGSNEIVRAQGAYLTDQEIEDVVEVVCGQREPQYDSRYTPGSKNVWKETE